MLHNTAPPVRATWCNLRATQGRVYHLQQQDKLVQVCVMQNYVYPLFLWWLFDCYSDCLCAAPVALCQTIEILDAAAVYSAEQL